jgi:hypothetical protein
MAKPKRISENECPLALRHAERHLDSGFTPIEAVAFGPLVDLYLEKTDFEGWL